MYAIKSIVLGCGHAVCSSYSTVTFFKTLSITLPVPCPSPVLARDPYSRTTKCEAVGFSLKNSLQARSGPIVCDEEGPLPILYNS